MARLVRHLIWYVALCGFLVVIWLLVGGGDPETFQQVLASPTEAVSLGFWPVWPILVFGTLLLMESGSVLSNATFGDRAARRRRKMARDVTESGKELAKDVGAAIERAHERRTRSREAKAHTVSTPSRRWVTVMFCDVAESTAHNERLGDEEWHRVLTTIWGVVRDALTQRGGTEVGTQGDGLLARFDDPPDAVLCAVDIQSELRSARATSDFVPHVRIGIHAGEAVEEQDGDLIGRVINLASRVSDAAELDEILVTEPVADQLVGKLELQDRGLKELKGISQPRHLLAVAWSADPA